MGAVLYSISIVVLLQLLCYAEFKESNWLHWLSRANVLSWQQNTNQTSVLPLMQTHAVIFFFEGMPWTKSIYQYELGLTKVNKRKIKKENEVQLFCFPSLSSLVNQHWMLSLHDFQTSKEARHKFKVDVQYCFVVYNIKIFTHIWANLGSTSRINTCSRVCWKLLLL